MRAFVTTLLLALLPILAGAQADDYLPIDQVKPGMQGYGYTVFRGLERERFELVVRSVVPHFGPWPAVIVVELHGGPVLREGEKPIMDQHQIFHGMSGSPMYVDGKLIGGLAMAKGFATTSKVLVTPIEYQIEMERMLKGGVSTGTSIAQPGDYVSTCFMYGDWQSCMTGTVTAKREGNLHVMSHEVGLPYGVIALPVFLVPVADLLESQDGNATKLSGNLDQPVGTAAAHGRFGFVVQEGVLPDMIPVRLTINESSKESHIRSGWVAYHQEALNRMANELFEYLKQFVPYGLASRLEVTITVENFSAPIQLADTTEYSLVATKMLLSQLMTQEGESLRIHSIDMRFSVLEKDDLWQPLQIQTRGKDEAGTLTVLARRGEDKDVAQISEPINLRPIHPYRKKGLKWMDGISVQTQILARMPVRQALGLLDQIKEREGLHLVWIEGDADMRIAKTSNARWHQRASRIVIAASTTMGGNRFEVMGTKPIDYVHK
jgi:hypothetical protein